MAKIELSIYKDYVRDWDVWCGVREIMQNAMDEHDKGRPMRVDHKGDVLTISNEGSELRIEHLLLGLTDKDKDKRARGEKGEGLDLGLLALTREGLPVVIRTPTENWRPEISLSESYDRDVLKIITRKVSKRRSGTSVEIKGINEQLWDQLRFRFLDFQKMGVNEKITVEYHGDLLLDSVHRGMIFVKGIYVQTDPEMRFGYNFFQVDLDRDRRMVKSFDLQWESGKILSAATKMRPELLLETVYGMLNNEEKDIRGFGQYIDDDVKEMIARRFKTEHGDDTIPVSSIGESEQIDSLGAKGVVAPLNLRTVIADVMDTPQILQEKIEKSTVKSYSWGELKPEEKAVLKKVSKQVQAALDAFRGNHSLCNALMVHNLYETPDDQVLECVNIVDFKKDSIHGKCNIKEGKIDLARKCLGNYFLALRILIHEYAHKLSKSGDGSVKEQILIVDMDSGVIYRSAR